jgi:hypothetical protein
VVDTTGTIPITRQETISDEAVTDADIIDDVQAHPEETTSLKALFFSKFPFCLPWDLYHAIKLIAAEPEAPRWEIDLAEPLRDRVPIEGDTTWVIDMGEFEIVGQIIRWASTITFCIFLISITRKLIRS